MRNLFGILTVAALVLLAAGQAAAYFTECDSICAVYTTAGNRVEEAFDLGPVANLPSSGACKANLAGNLSSFGSGASNSRLNVSCFAMSADESTFRVSGALMPVAATLYAQAQATLSGGLRCYGYSGAQSPLYSIGNPDSHYYLFDGNGSTVTASSACPTIHTRVPVDSPVPAAGLLFGSGPAVPMGVRRAIGNRARAVDRG
jgi:hypothetical protein